MNIDWENAPEGATHFRQNSIAKWYKISDSEKKYYLGKEYGWVESVSIKAGVVTMDDLIPRPTEPQWKNGLPPVGEVCKYKHKNLKDWEVCRIKYLGKNLTVICGVDEYEFEIAFDNELSGLEFRPLKTKAEIEREELINLIRADSSIESEDGNCVMMLDKPSAERLIDARWRPTK